MDSVAAGARRILLRVLDREIVGKQTSSKLERDLLTLNQDVILVPASFNSPVMLKFDFFCQVVGSWSHQLSDQLKRRKRAPRNSFGADINIELIKSRECVKVRSVPAISDNAARSR